MVLWYTKNNLKTLQRSIILYQQQQKNTLRPRLRMKQRNIPLRRKRLPFTPLAIQSNQLKVRWWSANMDLTKPATPAAPSKCPMLVFTSSKKKRCCESMNWYELRKMTPEFISNSWSYDAHVQRKQWSCFQIFHKMKQGLFDKSELQRLQLREFITNTIFEPWIGGAVVGRNT